MANFFQNNLKFLRKEKGVNQTEIALQLKKAHTSIGNYEKGISEPTISEIAILSQFFGISIEDLINTDLANTNILPKAKERENSKNTNKNTNIYTNKSDVNSVLEPIEVYGTNTGNIACNVYDLDSKAAAGVAAFMQDVDKSEVKPTIYMPNLGVGVHIRIKITGDSMHSTIKDGDYVIATYLTEPLKTLREGFIYVVLDKDDGVVCKRIYKQGKDSLELESDNDIYKPYNRHLNDILGLFKVVEIHTRDLRNYYDDTRREITKLWSAVEAINKKLPNSITKIKP